MLSPSRYFTGRALSVMITFNNKYPFSTVRGRAGHKSNQTSVICTV